MTLLSVPHWCHVGDVGDVGGVGAMTAAKSVTNEMGVEWCFLEPRPPHP